jgi:hypothetical protein
LTLFGRTLGTEEIASLVFMLLALVIWVAAWRGERDWSRGFRRWEGERRARRQAELSAEHEGQAPPPASDGPRGPWG